MASEAGSLAAENEINGRRWWEAADDDDGGPHHLRRVQQWDKYRRRGQKQLTNGRIYANEADQYPPPVFSLDWNTRGCGVFYGTISFLVFQRGEFWKSH